MYSRILHLIHTPRHSGAETLVRDLCLRHQERGISTAIASFAPGTSDFTTTLDKLRRSGTRLFLPMSELKGPQRIRHFNHAIRDFRPETIYAHSVLPALYGRLALPWFGPTTPFISVLHNANNDDYAEIRLRLSEIILANRASRIFAVSDEGAKSYARRVSFTPPIEVVPNGTDLNKIRSALTERELWRRRNGLDRGMKLILQVGRISRTKRQVETLTSLAPAMRKDESLRLWFAGLPEDADYAAKLASEITRLSLQNCATILGGRDDIPALLAAADLFVMPSLMEAHSIAMIEALASGLPIVASDIPTFRHLATFPGVMLFNHNDPAQYATSIAQSLTVGGRFDRDVGRFDIERVAAIYGGYA